MATRFLDILAVRMFGMLAAFCIITAHFVTATRYILCAGIWAFLTLYSIDGDFTVLPTRDDFLTALRYTAVQLGERAICLEDSQPTCTLPCGRHAFCLRCTRWLYAPDSLDERCPLCRIKLVREAAPWDDASAKMTVCAAVCKLALTLVGCGRLACHFEAAHVPVSIFYTLATFSLSSFLAHIWKILDESRWAEWYKITDCPTPAYCAVHALLLILLPGLVELSATISLEACIQCWIAQGLTTVIILRSVS